MYASVRALLNQIIDYAGLFPPAKLPLEEALRIYLHAKKTSPHAWMLGRFVCPVARLPELLALAHPNAALLSLTALGTQSTVASGFAEQLRGDLQTIQHCRTEWGQHAIIEAFEVAIPNGREGPASAVGQMLEAAGLCERTKLAGFFEIPVSPTWAHDVGMLATAIASVGVRLPNVRLGLKMRCGGVAAAAFPSDAQVAVFLHACRELRVEWKATAGLHHPRQHWDDSLQVWHHGFLNVFSAGVLAQVHALDAADLADILADRAGQHFHFENESLAWKNWSCTTAQITDARADFATSFGSCSFEEPCADLLALGLLNAEALRS